MSLTERLDPLAAPLPSAGGLYPESEATRMWCPLQPRTFHADGTVHNSVLCVASLCILWRSASPPKAEGSVGWCGLGGEPAPGAPEIPAAG